MDSKGKKIGILFVLCTLLAVMAAVLFAGYSRLMGKETGAAASGTDSVPRQIIEADGKVHGADLSAFMITRTARFLMHRHRTARVRIHMMRSMRTGSRCAVSRCWQAPSSAISA